MSKRYYCRVGGCEFETNKPKMARQHDEHEHPDRGLTMVDRWVRPQ